MWCKNNDFVVNGEKYYISSFNQKMNLNAQLKINNSSVKPTTDIQIIGIQSIKTYMGNTLL